MIRRLTWYERPGADNKTSVVPSLLPSLLSLLFLTLTRDFSLTKKLVTMNALPAFARIATAVSAVALRSAFAPGRPHSRHVCEAIAPPRLCNRLVVPATFFYPADNRDNLDGATCRGPVSYFGRLANFRHRLRGRLSH